MPRFRTSDGLSLHYQDEGRGAPVLCLAGLTRNAMDFNFLMPFLPDHRVIRLDYRGRGRSDFAPDFLSYSIAREALDVVELLDHLGLGRVALIGTSRGGLIAMLLAATHPDRLSAVVLNDIGPVLSGGGLERIIDYVGMEPAFADYDAAAIGLSALYADSFPGVPVLRWRLQARMMWHEKPGGGLGLRYDPRLRDALIAQNEATPEGGSDPDMWGLFDAAAALPLAVIRGANSDLLSAQTLAQMQARAPGMHAVTVPDRGHVPFLDEAESLAAIHWALEHSR